MGASFSLSRNHFHKGNHFHKIINNLYIGDMYSIHDKFFYNKKKLLVINATTVVKFNKLLKSTNIRIPVNDDLTKYSNTVLFNNMDHLTDIIHKYLKNDYIVLVHCVAGRQRSCAIVAGYLMKYHKMSKNNAIELIKSMRPYAFWLNINFNNCLQKYQQTL